MNTRVVCVGLSAWDITWEVRALHAGSGKIRAHGYRDGGGGMAANAAAAIARLGGRASLWSRGGQDNAGRAMRDELAALGVEVDAYRLFEGGRSSVSGIVVDAVGERAIVNFRGEGLPEDPGWLPLEQLARTDVVLADPRWPDGAEHAFRAARARGIATVLDGEVADAAVFDRLLPLTDHAVFSEPGLASYLAASYATNLPHDALPDALRTARARGCANAAVTLGERGVAWLAGDRPLERLPAYPVQVADTTGAGDVFHGALAFALPHCTTLRDALRFAAAAAALKCRARGGRAGLPDRAAVERLMMTSEE